MLRVALGARRAGEIPSSLVTSVCVEDLAVGAEARGSWILFGFCAATRLRAGAEEVCAFGWAYGIVSIGNGGDENGAQ